MGDIKFAVCLSVCSPETAEQIWQKFCREPEVCPGHCVGHLLAIAPGVPQGEPKNVLWGRYCVSLAMTNLLPPAKEEVNVFARVHLSVCLLARLLKTRAWIWTKCCLSTDVGTFPN